jgi:predicted ribosome quality control (RQC) complex YloA/Tae2 family protein
MKLRKLLKNKKLLNIEQLQHDRVVVLQFYNCNLVVEFFAAGNLILTDLDNNIIAILRVVEQLGLKLGSKYNFDLDAQLRNNANHKGAEIQPVDVENSADQDTEVNDGNGVDEEDKGLEINLSTQLTEEDISPFLLDTKDLFTQLLEAQKKTDPDVNEAAGKSKKVKKATLKSVLRQCYGQSVGPTVIDHILDISLLGSCELSIFTSPETSEFCKLKSTIDAFNADLAKSLKQRRGYITYKELNGLTEFEDFQPFPPISGLFLSFDSYNRTCDEYFYKSESQKLIQKNIQAEKQAEKKLLAVKSKNEEQIQSLEKQKIIQQQKAASIEANVDLVDNCIITIRF